MKMVGFFDSMFERKVLCLGCTWEGLNIECERWRLPGFAWDVKTLRCPRCMSSVASFKSAGRNYDRMMEGLAVSRRKNAKVLVKPANPVGQALKVGHYLLTL